MAATVQPGLISQALGLLPRPLLAVLDAWSYRVAQRRARERQQRWLQRAAASAPAPQAEYKLKPWRD